MGYLDPSEYVVYGLTAETTDDLIAMASALMEAYCRRPSLLLMQYVERMRLVALLFGLGLGQANAGDLRLGIGAARNARAVDCPGVLAGHARGDDQAGHRARVRQQRHSGDDIADGVDARLGRLHPLVSRDEAAVRLDIGLVQPDVRGARQAADGDQHLFRLLGLRLAVLVGPGDEHAFFVLLDLGVLDGEVHIDAALLELPQQLLADFFVFDGDGAGQHFR